MTALDVISPIMSPFSLCKSARKQNCFIRLRFSGHCHCQFYKLIALHVVLKQCKHNLFKWESKNQTNIFHKRKTFFLSLIVFASSNLFFKLFSYLIQFCVVFLNFFALAFFNRKKNSGKFIYLQKPNIFSFSIVKCIILYVCVIHINIL